MIALIVGIITNSVRNSAIPTSTWLGGVFCVPIAVRMKPSTIRIRLKPVTVNSSAGTSDSPPTSSRICTALLVSIFTAEAPVTVMLLYRTVNRRSDETRRCTGGAANAAGRPTSSGSKGRPSS